MAFRFNMRRAEKDPTGYYYTRWDRATPVSVIADSEPEAFKKLWALSGQASRDRIWTAQIDSIEEVPVTPAENEGIA